MNPSSTKSEILLTLLKESEHLLKEQLKIFLENGGEIEWNSLLAEAIYHGIAPVIYQNFKKANASSIIPDIFLKKLEAIYYGNARRNTRYFTELERILKSLKDTGVEPIVLKGGALAEGIYKNVALRPIEDIDLLIKKFDLPATKAVFKGWGYEVHERVLPSDAHRNFEKEIHKPFEKFESEIHFFKGKRDYFFDVHWNLLIICDTKVKEEGFQLNMERIWQRAKISSFGNAKGFLMSPEDLLIHLCLHLRERHFERARSRLIWWYDILKVLSTYEDKFDWDYFFASVREYEASQSIYSVIFTLKEWFDISLPQDFLKEAQNYSEIFPIERIVPNSSEQTKFKEKYQERDYLSELGKVEGVRKKIKLLFGDIFPKPEYMILRYQIKNKKLLPFYYLLRLKNALLRGFTAVDQYLNSKFKCSKLF